MPGARLLRPDSYIALLAHQARIKRHGLGEPRRASRGPKSSVSPTHAMARCKHAAARRLQGIPPGPKSPVDETEDLDLPIALSTPRYECKTSCVSALQERSFVNRLFICAECCVRPHFLSPRAEPAELGESRHVSSGIRLVGFGDTAMARGKRAAPHRLQGRRRAWARVRDSTQARGYGTG